MSRHRTYVRRFVATLAIAGAAVLGAPARAEIDLIAAWDAAQAKDPAYAAARAERDAGDARGRQGQALRLPTVTVQGGLGYGTTQQDTSGAQFTAPGFGTSNGVEFRTDVRDATATSWKITAQQPIYNAENSVRARQLELQTDVAALQYAAARQELMLRTVRTFLDVLLAEEALEEILRQRKAALRALDVARDGFDEGKLPVTDRNEALARLDEIHAREALARDDLELKRALFTDLTGLPGTGLARIAADRPLRAFDAGALESWLAKASEASPAIRLRILAGDIAAEEVHRFGAVNAPSLTLVAQAGGDRWSGSSGFGGSAVVNANTSLVGLQLSIPLYTGGLRNARHDEAVALADKARYDVDATRKAVLQVARTAWFGTASGLARIRARERALESAAARLDATAIGHEVGARTTLDLLNAQADRYRAERELAQAKYQLLLDRLALLQAAGELSEESLRSANANFSR